jgi:tetraacyldisaccharide 4'-kinase
MTRQKPISLERRIERLWYGDSAFALLLLPLSWVFHLAVSLRRAAYRRGLFASANCGVPVIVVGNITVGGAGKTPLVGWIANRLVADGRKVGVLSRGYGGAESSQPRMVTADSRAADVGDEAVLLARQINASVCVSPDRVAGARHLIDAAGVNVIVCDDGLQHYRLERDFEVAVIDGSRGLGNGHLLPAGPLREPRSRLDHVDLVFCNGEAEAAGHSYILRPGGARGLGAVADCDLEAFRGQRVWAVAGIGNPQRFVAVLRDAGMEPALVDVPDHGVVELESLRREQSWPILMTEKDAVKYPGSSIDDVWYVPVEVVMSSADEAALMGRIRELYVKA